MNFIKELYTPVQPAINQSAKFVQYKEVLPHPQLQHIIFCYWQLKTIQPLVNEFTYRVVSDGCIDIYFELNNPVDSYVMGFCKKYTEFQLGNSFHYCGIRFLPTMFPQLFNINAKDLSDRYEKLNNIIPAVANYISNQVSNNMSDLQIASTFDNYFIKVLNTSAFNDDNRLYEALHIILKNYGVLNIEKDLDTGISSRQLRRLFEFYIGDTAKTFCKVVRFQNILRAKPSLQSLRKNKLFFDAGYYDQAHFIKEFKNFFGVTPSKAFGR